MFKEVKEGRTHQPLSTQRNREYPKSLSRGREDARLTMSTTIKRHRRVQRTLTGETAEATWHCGKVCKNIRGLRIHQSRTQCGQAGKQIQRTIVTTVGETAENFNQDQHHSSEALSETETMHASTMNSDNHARSSNRDESPDPLLELLSSPIDSSTSVTNGGASITTTHRTTCTRKQKIK